MKRRVDFTEVESVASRLIIEIGITVVVLGILGYYVSGFFGSGDVPLAVVLLISGFFLTVVGFAIGRRGDNRR